MNTRHALVLTVASILFLIGCTTTTDERHLEKLVRHRDWPRIEQIARTEVKKREILWPDNAAYLPTEHKDKVWGVGAMAGERTVMLTIGDDGSVLAYRRNWEGK